MEEQTEQHQNWWQKNQNLLMRTMLVILLAVVIVLIMLIILGYIFNWDWTGLNATNLNSTPQQTTRIIVYQPGKTLWDWLGLLGVLAIPVVVGWFTFQQGRASDKSRQQQKETELEIATDNQREQAIQAYIDKMSELLLDKDLRTAEPGDEIWSIARARTLTVLRGLDPRRKGNVILFLSDAKLISILDLSGADLTEARLSLTHLESANLIMANLRVLI